MDNLRNIFVDRFNNAMGNAAPTKKVITPNNNTATNSNISDTISVTPIFVPFGGRQRSMSESSTSDESLLSTSATLDQTMNCNNGLHKKESEAYFWIMWRA